MFSWINKDDQRKREPEVYASVAEGLKKVYQQVHYAASFAAVPSFIWKPSNVHFQFVSINISSILIFIVEDTAGMSKHRLKMPYNAYYFKWRATNII